MSATHSKKPGSGFVGTVEENSKNMNHLSHSPGKQANWRQVSTIIWNKMSIPVKLSHSQAKIWHSLPLCEQLQET